MNKQYKEVIVLCTNTSDYLKSMKLLQFSGYIDVAGTPEDYATDFLKRDGILAIAAFSDMSLVVGAFYPKKYKQNINTDTFIVKKILHSKDLNEEVISTFWKRYQWTIKINQKETIAMGIRIIQRKDAEHADSGMDISAKWT